MEYFEIMNTNLTQLAEWLAYEGDMATNPYGESEPSEAEILAMAGEAGA